MEELLENFKLFYKISKMLTKKYFKPNELPSYIKNSQKFNKLIFDQKYYKDNIPICDKKEIRNMLDFSEMFESIKYWFNKDKKFCKYLPLEFYIFIMEHSDECKLFFDTHQERLSRILSEFLPSFRYNSYYYFAIQQNILHLFIYLKENNLINDLNEAFILICQLPTDDITPFYQVIKNEVNIQDLADQVLFILYRKQLTKNAEWFENFISSSKPEGKTLQKVNNNR